MTEKRPMIRHYVEHGMYLRQLEAPNPGETIVYIHGLGESGLCFEKLIADSRLQTWSHLVPDLPGYGKSPWPAQPMGLKKHVDHLSRWLKNRNISQLVVLGHSMGGMIGLMLCEKHPELMRGFINVEGNVSLEDCAFSSKVASYTRDELITHGFETICDTIYHNGFEDKALRTYYASLRMCDPRVYHLNSIELIGMSRTGDLAARLGALKVPNIYILGSPRGTGEHSRRLLTSAGVKWHPVEDAGHWPFIDQQAAFVEEVLRYLNQLSRRDFLLNTSQD
jgi:pimeloyl-ACP methyl ester carboxylesterase